MRSSEKHRALFQAIATLAAVTALIAVYLYTKSTPLDKDDLKVIVSEFRSSAAEGDLLSDQIKQQKVDSTYAFEHIGMMLDDLDNNLKSLKKSHVDDDLILKKEQTINLAEDLTNRLKNLQSLTLRQNEFLIPPDLKQLFESLAQIEKSLE